MIIHSLPMREEPDKIPENIPEKNNSGKIKTDTESYMLLRLHPS